MMKQHRQPSSTRGEGAGGNREVPAAWLPARLPPVTDRVMIGAARSAA